MSLPRSAGPSLPAGQPDGFGAAASEVFAASGTEDPPADS